MGYLGFWVTRNGDRPINKKVEAMVNMMPPKRQKYACMFIGLVNYFMYMWARRSHLLQPLTALTSNKVTFEWTDVEQKPFDDIKFIVACNTLLAYPYSNKQFDILFFLFYTGLRDLIACSILGGGIPAQNIGYNSTRLFPF